MHIGNNDDQRNTTTLLDKHAGPLPLSHPLLIATLLLLLGVTGFFVKGRDYQPALWALQIELQGASAYGPQMQERFAQEYAEPFASGGFAYPLPVIWLALPIIALPASLIPPIWNILNVGSVLLGLRLLRMPLSLGLFLPLLLGMYLQQITVLLTGLLLIGIWAWRVERWWFLGLIIALTIAAKPQTTLLIAAALMVLAFRSGAWRPVVVCGLAVSSLTFLLEPTWLPQWLAALEQYRSAIGLNWVYEWLPIALFLFVFRQFWGGLAVLQISLFPTLFGYTLLPLLLGYVEPEAQRFAPLAVAASWITIFLVEVRPLWLVNGIGYLLPLILGAIVHAYRWKSAKSGLFR